MEQRVKLKVQWAKKAQGTNGGKLIQRVKTTRYKGGKAQGRKDKEAPGT